MGEQEVSSTTRMESPLTNLSYDWVAILHKKAEGLKAYEKYIKDAEDVGAQQCVELMKKIYRQDVQIIEEIKEHLKDVIGETGEHGSQPTS